LGERNREKKGMLLHCEDGKGSPESHWKQRKRDQKTQQKKLIFPDEPTQFYPIKKGMGKLRTNDAGGPHEIRKKIIGVSGTPSESTASGHPWATEHTTKKSQTFGWATTEQLKKKKGGCLNHIARKGEMGQRLVGKVRVFGGKMGRREDT